MMGELQLEPDECRSVIVLPTYEDEKEIEFWGTSILTEKRDYCWGWGGCGGVKGGEDFKPKKKKKC